MTTDLLLPKDETYAAVQFELARLQHTDHQMTALVMMGEFRAVCLAVARRGDWSRELKAERINEARRILLKYLEQVGKGEVNV